MTLTPVETYIERLHRDCARLRQHIAELEDALIWCSGSGDFAPEGKARKGFLKIVRPLLSRIQEGPDG